MSWTKSKATLNQDCFIATRSLLSMIANCCNKRKQPFLKRDLTGLVIVLYTPREKEESSI